MYVRRTTCVGTRRKDSSVHSCRTERDEIIETSEKNFQSSRLSGEILTREHYSGLLDLRFLFGIILKFICERDVVKSSAKERRGSRYTGYRFG